MKRPWYVYACFALAFLGGGFTVALCAVAFVVYVVVATFRWFATTESARVTPTRERTDHLARRT